MIPLETFNGFVDGIKNGIAYVTLKSIEHGDTLWGEIEAQKLLDLGICERRRFKCMTVEQQSGEVSIEFQMIPPKELTDEDHARIDKMLENLE